MLPAVDKADNRKTRIVRCSCDATNHLAQVPSHLRTPATQPPARIKDWCSLFSANINHPRLRSPPTERGWRIASILRIELPPFQALSETNRQQSSASHTRRNVYVLYEVLSFACIAPAPLFQLLFTEKLQPPPSSIDLHTNHHRRHDVHGSQVHQQEASGRVSCK